MQKFLKEKFKAELQKAPFDHMAVGLLDLKKKSYSTASLLGAEETFFDLASISKVFNLAGAKLIYPELFDAQMDLLLNHQGGLPAWGLLSHSNWKDQLLQYEIKESPVEYSDFSALRLMLELEQKSKKSLYELMKPHWHDDIRFWKDLELSTHCPCYGMRSGKKIIGEVHDPNAYNLDCYTSHAGLFAPVAAVLETILRWNEQFQLLSYMEQHLKKKNADVRYVNGWDTLARPDDSLAGRNLSSFVFGHLGFTGTSLWIDCERQLAVVILTNAVQFYWYEREILNKLRKEIGTLLFHEKDLL